MKKWICMLLLLGITLSCCACAGEETVQTQPTETTQLPTEEPVAEQTPAMPQTQTPEQLFGHINQLEPVDGVYKIWNAEGVKNMANHPDGDFELLCNVDMAGAELVPIGSAEKPFTGKVEGSSFTISNFTLTGGADGNFGFVAVNKGAVRNLTLDQVTFKPDSAAKNIGALAGINEGKLTRCKAIGVLSVEQTAADANCGSCAGISSGDVSYTELYVDMLVTAADAVNVGGIAGSLQGGKLEYVESYGKLEIEGQQKHVGLYAGTAKDTELIACVFSGETNKHNGQLFTNFNGLEENVTATDCLWRDNDVEPLPDNVRALRQKVVDAMNAMGSVKWNLHKDLIHSCTCQLSSCHGSYSTQYTYYGLPYNHKSSPLERFEYCLTEDGYIPDWFYDLPSFDGFDRYFGTDCSAALQQAWWTVSNSVTLYNTNNIAPYYNMGTIPVGDYKWDMPMENNWTQVYIDAVDEQTMYEAYGKMRAGDGYVCRGEVGGHTRMAVEDAVVVRDQEGKINPKYSYVISSEQGATIRDDATMTISTWKLNFKYTFANLYYDWYIPVTCEELLSGEMEPLEVTLESGCEGYAGMFTGTVKANYRMNGLTMKIVNGSGDVILDRTMWTSVDRQADFGSNAVTGRMLIMEQDMARFTAWLQDIAFEKGETYHYTVTAHVATGDKVEVLSSNFVYGE